MLELSGNHIVLKAPEMKDIGSIIDFYTRNQSHLKPYEPIKPEDFYTECFWTNRMIQINDKFEKNQEIRFLLFNKEDKGTVIGVLNFTQIFRMPFFACSMGFCVDSNMQGTGLMAEGIQLGVRYMFDVQKLHRIQANYMPHNIRSGKLLKKMGFKVEGYANDYLMINGKWEDHILTSLTNHLFSAE